MSADVLLFDGGGWRRGCVSVAGCVSAGQSGCVVSICWLVAEY